MHKRYQQLALIGLLSAVFTLNANMAFAHGSKKKHSDVAPQAEVAEPAEQTAWGIAGKAAGVDRTIELSMKDIMRFAPDALKIKTNETIRFVVKNEGKLLHEFVIGTRENNNKHAALMLRFPNMEHDEPHQAHVQPNDTGEIIWRFNRAGQFDFACLIAGHYQAGMIGSLDVRAGN